MFLVTTTFECPEEGRSLLVIVITSDFDRIDSKLGMQINLKVGSLQIYYSMFGYNQLISVFYGSYVKFTFLLADKIMVAVIEG